MITARRTSAFTLIELLIVVAIIAIIVGSSLTVVTAPMFERMRADDEQSFETGAGVLFSQLAEDAHRARQLDAGTSGTLTLTLAAPDNAVITYSTTQSGTLWRKGADQQTSATLLTGVQQFTAEKQPGGLYRVKVTARLQGYGKGLATITRSMDVAVAADAAGGQP